MADLLATAGAGAVEMAARDTAFFYQAEAPSLDTWALDHGRAKEGDSPVLSVLGGDSGAFFLEGRSCCMNASLNASMAISRGQTICSIFKRPSVLRRSSRTSPFHRMKRANHILADNPYRVHSLKPQRLSVKLLGGHCECAERRSTQTDSSYAPAATQQNQRGITPAAADAASPEICLQHRVFAGEAQSWTRRMPPAGRVQPSPLRVGEALAAAAEKTPTGDETRLGHSTPSPSLCYQGQASGRDVKIAEALSALATRPALAVVESEPSESSAY